MICSNCNKEIPDGSLFCAFCGTKQEKKTVINLKKPEENPAPENPPMPPEGPAPGAIIPGAAPPAPPIPPVPPVPPIPPMPPEKPKKKWLMPLITVIAGIIAIGATALLLISSKPSVKLAKAALKSFDKYEEAYSAFTLPDAEKMVCNGKYSENFEVKLRSINGDNKLKGLGILVSNGIDEKSQKFYLSFVPYYSHADIIGLNIVGDKNWLYVGADELLKGKYVAIDTTKLGETLKTLSGDETLPDLHFNTFEVIAKIKELSKDEEGEKELKALLPELKNAIKVKKAGKENIEVFNKDLQAVCYEVNISMKEVRSLLKKLFEIVQKNNLNTDKLEELLVSIGVSQDDAKGLIKNLKKEASDNEWQNELEENLKDIEDIVLYAYTDKEYLRKVSYEGKISDTKLEVALELGKNENDLGEDIRVLVYEKDGKNSENFTVSSHQERKNGFINNEFAIALNGASNSYEIFEMESEYDTKKGNFEAEISCSDFEAEISGNLKSSKSSLELSDTRIRCNYFDVEVNYNISDSFRQSVSFDKKNVYDLGTMDSEDLKDLANDLYDDLIGDVLSNLDFDIYDILNLF